MPAKQLVVRALVREEGEQEREVVLVIDSATAGRAFSRAVAGGVDLLWPDVNAQAQRDWERKARMAERRRSQRQEQDHGQGVGPEGMAQLDRLLDVVLQSVAKPRQPPAQPEPQGEA